MRASSRRPLARLRRRLALPRHPFARLPLVLLVFLAALTAVASLTDATAVAGARSPAGAVRARITTILRANGFYGGATGVSVWRLGDLRAVYGRHTTTLLAPASNMKLVTAASALLRWGPDHRFKTELYLPSAPPDPPAYGEAEPYTVEGDVYLKGYGDPSLSTTSYQTKVLHMSTSSIQGFVKVLQDEGVTAIHGSVIADESWFDTKRTVPTWKSGLAQDCGRLSALTVNESLKDGRRVLDPAQRAARVLTDALEDAGIDVSGSPGKGVVPDGSYLAVTSLSAPLKTILRRMDRDSDNFFAETLLKGLGRDFRSEGSTAAGLRVSRGSLKALGIPLTDVRLDDGSGLSYRDRLTAAVVAKLLRVASAQTWAAQFRASLSVAGRNGTLIHRMRGTAAEDDFRGKTGTLNIASCLSGYVTTRTGHKVVVSMLMNGWPCSTWSAQRAQDAIAVCLARSGL